MFVYAYDFTVYGGSLSASNAKKIVKVQQLALKNGAPIIALNDSDVYKRQGLTVHNPTVALS